MLIQVLKVGSGLVGTLQPFKLLDIFNGFRTLNVLKNQPELELRPVFLAPDVYIHIRIYYIKSLHAVRHPETSIFKGFFFPTQSVSQSVL